MDFGQLLERINLNGVPFGHICLVECLTNDEGFAFRNYDVANGVFRSFCETSLSACNDGNSLNLVAYFCIDISHVGRLVVQPRVAFPSIEGSGEYGNFVCTCLKTFDVLVHHIAYIREAVALNDVIGTTVGRCDSHTINACCTNPIVLKHAHYIRDIRLHIDKFWLWTRTWFVARFVVSLFAKCDSDAADA